VTAIAEKEQKMPYLVVTTLPKQVKAIISREHIVAVTQHTEPDGAVTVRLRMRNGEFPIEASFEQLVTLLNAAPL
jgi:hypothetical protein